LGKEDGGEATNEAVNFLENRRYSSAIMDGDQYWL
jgi:hypothetical protein